MHSPGSEEEAEAGLRENRAEHKGDLAEPVGEEAELPVDGNVEEAFEVYPSLLQLPERTDSCVFCLNYSVGLESPPDFSAPQQDPSYQ